MVSDGSIVPPERDSCRYLGLEDDPQTFLAVPSLLNLCYRAAPHEPVRLEHQRIFCQTADHSRCPVLQAEDGGRLPLEIRARRPRVPGFRPALALWFLPLAAAGALAVGLLLDGGLLARLLPVPPPPRTAARIVPSRSPTPITPSATAFLLLPPLPAVSHTAVRPSATVLTPMQTASYTPTPSVTVKPTSTLTATITHTPTATPSPIGQCGHELEQAFGSTHQLLVHRVLGGESLNMFADRYDTTVEVIEEVNFGLYVPIRNESVVVVAPGLRQTSVLPAFEARDVPAPGLSLSSLAAQLPVPTETLLQYNAFSGECHIILGWIVIPHESTPTP